MSTDVYGVKILQVEDDTVNMKVFNVYRDWIGYLPSPFNPFFFFMVLGDSPNYDVKSFIEKLSSEFYKEDFIFSNSANYIKSIEIIDFENLLNDMNYDFYYERDGKWKNEDQLPCITYKVTVTDNELLAHLSAGLAWGTTCYESEWNMLAEEKFNTKETKKLKTASEWFSILNETNINCIAFTIQQVETDEKLFNEILNNKDVYDLWVNRLTFLLNEKKIELYGWSSQICLLLARLKYKPLLNFMCSRVARIEQDKKFRNQNNSDSSSPINNKLQNYLLNVCLLGLHDNKLAFKFFESLYIVESTHLDAKFMLAYALFMETKDRKYHDYFSKVFLEKANGSNANDTELIYALIKDLLVFDLPNVKTHFCNLIEELTK
ncbi:MAG: hypothetical protein ABIP68_09810, partial [Ferruginibacter sp.]